MENKIDEILRFWFQGVTDLVRIQKDAEPFKNWFMKNQAFDDEIKTKFENDLIKAKSGDYKDWEKSAEGRLALIILFDQFSRNIYRNTATMYDFDPLALDLASKGVDERMDSHLALIQRTFLYMPLMHAENVELQKKCVDCFESLVGESEIICPENTGYYQYSLDYAKKHYDIVKRFGRFPHRNEILKRKSTSEEVDFLKQPNSSF